MAKKARRSKSKAKKSKAKSKSKKKKVAKKTKKAKRKKGRRTVLYSSKGKKLYAVRDKGGKFKDIQSYQRAHSMDMKRDSKDEAASSGNGAAPAASSDAPKPM